MKDKRQKSQDKSRKTQRQQDCKTARQLDI